MAIIIATIAFLLCWVWIEITLFFTNKNTSELDNRKGISYKKFIWILRILGVFYRSNGVIWINLLKISFIDSSFAGFLLLLANCLPTT